MTPRYCVCIPVYDNPATVVQVAKDCLAETTYPIIVIDDGSPEAVSHLFRDATLEKAIAEERLILLRFGTNRGKGAALRHGFAEAIHRGFTHAIAIDADGQHKASEIPKLVRAADADPWSLVIGKRDLAGKDVPEISRFGRAFSNFWVKYQTGYAISDSQSGFRLYPLFHLQNLSFFTRRYDFEIEVLIRLLWKDVKVHEVAIDVHYPRSDERVSHFDKFRDNVRISILNSALVCLSLLKSPGSAARTGVSFGVGVFIGCSPFWGFHVALSGVAAFLFRLNAPIVWLGTNISMPPVGAAIIFAAIKTGYWIAGVNFPATLSEMTVQTAAHSFVYWFLGSLVIGTVLGGISGTLAWRLALELKTRKKTAWNGTQRGGKLGNACLRLITANLGLEAGYVILFFLVPYFYLFAPRGRKASLEYWRVTEPNLSLLGRHWRVLTHFFVFGKLLLDRLYQTHSAEPRFTTRSTGFENIQKHLDAGEGLVLLSAHVGGWDMAAAYVHLHHVKDPFHLFQFEGNGPTVHNTRGNAEPAQSAVHFVNRETQPILSVHQFLSGGKVVGLMADRPVGKHYELVRFFGKLAAFDTTAFRIAAATKKPLAVSFGFKAEKRIYDFLALPAKYYLYPPGEDRSAVCRAWAQEFAEVLEWHVRRYPNQWLNFFPFWSMPPNPPAISAIEPGQAGKHSAVAGSTPVPTPAG